MAPPGRKKGKEVDRSPTSILKHGDYTVSLTSWLAGGPVVLGKKPRRVLDLKVERDRKSEKSDQSLVLARKKDNDAAASDMDVGTSGSEGALTQISRQRRQTEGSSQPVVSSRPFLTYEEERVEKFTIRPPPVIFNTPEDVPTGWLEAMLNQRKNGESSKAVPKKVISYEHSDSEDYEAGYDCPPHSKSKSLPKKSSSSSRKASEIRIETKSSSKKGTRKIEVTTADATDESDESSSDVESRRPTKTKKLERRSKTRERSKTKKIQVESSDEETADEATTDTESSDIESTDVELRSKPTLKKKPSTSSKKAGSSKVKVETRGRKGKRKVVVEASSDEEDSSVESMTEAEPSPPKKVKNKNRVTVTETTRKGKKKIVTVESSDEADITHLKSRSSKKGKKSEIYIKTSGKEKAKKVTFEPTDEAEITHDATTDAEPTPAKAQKGKGKIKTKAIDKGKTKAKKKIEVESPDPAETTDAVTTDDATQTEAETTEAATTEAETTDAETTVAEKPKGTPAAGKTDNGWTPSQDASILSMKEGGESWANIGNAIGRNKNEVKKRHQELVRTGAAQVNKGNQSEKAHKAQNKENKNNNAGSSQTPTADETIGFDGFGELPGFGADQDDNNNDNNNNNNNGDHKDGGGDQNNSNHDNNNNTDNNGGGGEGGGWGGGNQNDNGGGDVGPGFNTPAWSADCTGGGDQDTTNNNNSNNDTNNNGFGNAGWGGGDQENNGGGNVGPGPGDGWAADCTGGDKPPSNSGSKNGSNQGKPPSNSGNWGQSSNQGNSGNIKPPSNSGGGWNNGGSNQGNKPPSNSGGGGVSNQGNKPPSNSGGWNNGGSNHGSNNNKPPSNSGGDWNGGRSNQGNKPPSNNGRGGSSNQGNRPPSNSGNNGWSGGSNQGNKPPSNSGGNNGGSNQGSNNNKPPSNSGGGWDNGGSNQGNKPPSNKPPSNNGDWGNVGPTQGSKPPSNNGGWGSGSNQGNKPPSNSGGWNNGGSNQGNRPSNNKPPSNNGDWGSGSNQGNNNNTKSPSNSGGWNNGGSNHGGSNNKPPSNNSRGGGSNQGNKPPSNNGDWGNTGPTQDNNGGWASGSNQGNNYTKPPSKAGSARGSNQGRPPSNNGGWGSGSNTGNRPPSNNGDWGSGSNHGNNNNTNPPSNDGWGGGSDQGRPPSNSGGWGSGSNNGNKPPSNSGSNRGSGSQQGDPKAKSMEKELSIKDQEIKSLKERVSAEKLQRLEAEVFALKIQNSANRLNQNKQPEDGMGWNTGGSDNNWRPPSAAGSSRSNKQPDNNAGWKSGPGSGEVWSVAPNPDYKLPSNSGWVPRDFAPPQGSKSPSNNNAPPGSPDGWIYGSPTESERNRVAKRVETWKGSISPPKERGRWGTPDGGWHANPVTESRRRENTPDNNTRGRSPAARSASAKEWKQGLTRVDEEPDNGYDMWKKPSNNGKPAINGGHGSPGNLNNKPSGEQYGWNSGPDAAAGTGWGGGSDRVSTPSFKPPENNDWAGGSTRNDKPPSNKPPSNNGDWTPGLGGTGWKADCTKPPSNSGWGGGSNQGKDNTKPPSNAGSARGSNYGKPPSNNGGWNYAPIGGTSKNNNKAAGSDNSLTGFLRNPPAWGADCTGPWDSNKPANNKADKGDDQNALTIHTVTDLPGYNRDVAPIGLSGFPPVVEHYAPIPVPPVTPGPPGRYPSTPYSATPHPPGYLPKSEAQTTLLPLYNNPPPHAQYPSHEAPWNSTSWDTKPALTTKPPGGPSSYQPGQRSAQCKTLSEKDLQSVYKQVVFSAMSSRQPLPQPKPDRDFTLRDCWVLIALSEQYDRSSASKEKWFELQAKFAEATGRMVDAKLLRQKVKQGEKEGKVVERWEDDEVGWRYKRERERKETAW